jgi:hypothetical protein
MSYSTILAQVKSTLEGVSGVANVYDYQRYSSDLSTLKSLFVSNSIFHGWMITRVSAPATANITNQVFRQHQFELLGFYQVDDSLESEKTFQALCDTIMNTFDLTANLTLGGTADQIQAAQLLEFVQVEFVGVLCHHARILIQADEEVTQ